MDETKFIHATYSTIGFDTKPTPMEYAIRNKHLVSDVISPLDLCMLIIDGKSYGNQAIRETGKPSKFIAGSIISVDLEGSPACHIDIATKEDLWKDFGMLAYTTMSHTETNPRCRLVFATKEPFTDESEYRHVAKSLCSAWGEGVDKASWEPYRLFLGNAGCRIEWNGNVLPRDIYMQMLREAKRREKNREEEIKARYKESEGRAESFVEYALRTVAGSNIGERNNALNRVSFLAGKHYVGTGKIEEQYIVDELVRAAIACGLDELEARKTISASIKRGKLLS